MHNRTPPDPASLLPFTVFGEVLALQELRKGRRPHARPMGGWLMTYGKLDGSGNVVPTVDRDGQVMEAARGMGEGVDVEPYLKGGRWNDTHDETTLVGLPDSLEYHPPTSPLAKAHGKVGFWTTGHLFDSSDPDSWKGLGRTPTPREIERADHFWNLAHLLKGTPRPIGLSAHGLMALSDCGRRIVYAKLEHAAVCELPVNPDATLEMLKAHPLQLLRKGRKPCANCGKCQGECSIQDTELPTDGTTLTDREKIDRLVELVAKKYNLSPDQARTWVRDFLTRTRRQNDGRQERNLPG